MNLPHSLPPGFEVPLHRSLTEPILMGGAPRTVAIATVRGAPPSRIGSVNDR